MRTNLNAGELTEAILELVELQAQLEPLVNQVYELVSQVGDDYAMAYTVSQLMIAVMDEHPWISRDESLQGVIRNWQRTLKELDGDEVDEEDEDDLED